MTLLNTSKSLPPSDHDAMDGDLIKNYVMVMKNPNLYLQSAIMLNIKMWHDLVCFIATILIGRVSNIRMGLHFKCGWQCFCSCAQISRNSLPEFIYRNRMLNWTTREWAMWFFAIDMFDLLSLSDWMKKKMLHFNVAVNISFYHDDRCRLFHVMHIV